jgi:hypothetical protein
MLSIKDDDQLSMAFWHNDAYQNIGTSTTLNKWDHVVFIYESALTIKFYTDGKFMQEGSLSSGISADTINIVLRIGCTDDPRRCFNEIID